MKFQEVDFEPEDVNSNPAIAPGVLEINYLKLELIHCCSGERVTGTEVRVKPAQEPIRRRHYKEKPKECYRSTQTTTAAVSRETKAVRPSIDRMLRTQSLEPRTFGR